jgi:hypothetical protein
MGVLALLRGPGTVLVGPLGEGREAPPELGLHGVLDGVREPAGWIVVALLCGHAWPSRRRWQMGVPGRSHGEAGSTI